MTYSDDYIEHWGAVFTANNLPARGIVFEVFLQAPRETLSAVVYGTPMPLLGNLELYPLLPEQLEIKQRLEKAEDIEAIDDALSSNTECQGHIVSLRNTHLFQSMRHWAPSKAWKTRRAMS